MAAAAARPGPLLRRTAARTISRPSSSIPLLYPHVTRRPAAATFSTTPTIRSSNPTSSSFSTTTSNSNNDADRTTTTATTTHFGFQDGLSEAEKTQRVTGVFNSVADSYDRMNDLMSFGWHRVWKDHFVSSLNPGASASTPPAPQRILDVAGGTGDIAFRLLHHAHAVNRNPGVRVTMSDINGAMLAAGARRAAAQLPASQQAALSILEWDATKPFPPPSPEHPAGVPPGSVDLYTVAFGIRNFGSVRAGLAEAYRVLRPGGLFACLEFSRVDDSDNWIPWFGAAYRRWSFGAIPLIGQLVAGDRGSYQYLVESIARFPAQEEFRALIEEAGFVVAGRGYENLTGGVAAIHKGMKPLA